MWKDPDPDPGGSAQEGAAKGLSLQELADLKDQNEQQQLLIAQLKEMLRKEQSSVTQEKVEEYVNTLSKVKAKKSRLKKENPGHAERSASSSSIDIHKKGKLNLLKQQLEENKAKLAERGKSQKGIEEMVSQLKAQLNDSQQLIPLNISLADVKPLDYNKNSTPEELYNILLTKEKKITELINKNLKQEATILDLEENLKEKDSVIDARTKAITLMTDSLSKKGKTTLDALDDTKEQMRKMQENFITLESEMKARQVKLLNDLKAKNFEIAELQENNQKLDKERNEYLKSIEEYKSSEGEGKENQIEALQQQLDQTKTQNNEYLSKITELEKRLQENLDDLNRLKNTGVTVSTLVKDDSETAKLRKQLEESNKNMIKVKAQSKGKIKELNKRIDQFKKASDTNALIVQLQAENTKLSEKIAELEEEKGNLQLKMVDSTDSMKDSTQLVEYRELENKLERNMEELTEKDKVISLLEADIISLKEEIKSLNEKVDNFSHLKNVQVTSEIKSIQIEEQLDNIEIENVKLKEKIDQLLKEREELSEKIEELKREKQEISSKLDSYIQENMELIDKLEKLSAEKVSSAESIEIVEGLTQQEKLELAAYQKNLDIHVEGEPVKLTEDDNIEPPAELNESVLQLNEDSTELLQKIDMFNMERKEVMGKMEALKEENSQLNLKIKEIENNRDILAETYEQLQTEKEMLQSENDQLVKKIQKLEEEGHSEKEKVSENTDLEELREDYQKSLAEVQELKRTLKEYNDRIQENTKLESELSQSRKTIDELNASLKANQDELTNYHSIITENKNEFINYANIINDLQNKLTGRESDISDLNVIISDLNALVNNLQSENSKLGNFEIMEKQLAELQTALTGQIQQAQDYEEEIAQSNDIINELNTKLVEMNKKIIETEHEIDVKDIEAKKLAQDLQNKDETIQNLQVQIEERDRKINIVVHEMKEKYLGLQKQLDGNNGSLETKITELTNKNKEQLEKMKKIAANLKKKTQAYQELEEKYNGEKEKWELEVNEKESIIINSNSKILSFIQQLKELEEEVSYKTARLAEAENQTRQLRELIQGLEQSKVELQNSIIELKRKEDKLNEVNLKQELSTSLHEDFDDIPSNQNSANEEKIKELELIIETNEADLAHYNERIHKLEEDIACLEQEKETIERDNLRLSEQLNITSKNVEEKAMLEEELGQKLLQVRANDEALVKRLEQVSEENKGLTQKNKELEELTQKLKMKVKKSNERINQLKTLQTNVEELETANRELKKQVATLEAHQKHIQDENEELQKKNQNDYERIESDYQTQLEELLKCKNDLTVECEKLQETLKEMERREEELLSEITEYKQKMEQIEANNQQTILQLAEDLTVANDNWKESLKEVESLTQQIEEQNKQLVVKVAKQTIEDVIGEAQEKIFEVNSVGSQTDIVGNAAKEEVVEDINKTEDKVPTFHWPAAQHPDHTQDWFAAAPSGEVVQQDQQVRNIFSAVPNVQSDWFAETLMTADSTQPTPFHPQSEAQQPVLVDNTKEALLKKIKALEFLLYNVDKEKEEALEECTGMVNELTHLVYEKVSTPKAEIAAKEIEAQVMSDLDIADAASDEKQLQQIEFEQADVSVGAQSLPVFEFVAQPKRAYLTYQPEDKAPSSIKLEAFGENDDGWGWGPEEAKLEEEHLHQAESTPQVHNLKSEIARLNERVQVLQVERENHLEDIKQLQIKSGKLIKKCKELKQKNDQLMAKQQSKKGESSDFFNLDETIQEELKTQITQLEKRTKELTNELEKEKHEKTNILKRADVLTAANERMLEMKEIQDTEVLHWKRKYQELEEKLQEHEWGSDGFNERAKPVSSSVNVTASAGDNKKIEEMQQQIKELMLDNEEMQTLLDEQQLRINAEKLKSVTETSRIQEEHKLNMNLEDTMKGLEQELFKKSEELKVVFNEKAKISAECEELQQVIKEKEKTVLELQDSLRTLVNKNSEAERLLIEKDKLVKDLLENEKSSNTEQELRQSISQLEQNILQLKEEKSQQELLLTEKDAAYNDLSNIKQELSRQVAQLSADLEQQKQKYNELQVGDAGKIEELTQKLELQKQRLIESERRIEEMGKNYEQVQLKYTAKVAEVEQFSKQLQEQQLKSVEADTFEVATQKYQLESLLAEKESQINELNSQKLEFEGEIQQLKHSLDQKQKEYEQLVMDTEESIRRTVVELEQSWEAQVDQRGADVAESWKLHLEKVEADFATLQEKLKYEINELEEKCNVLVNENNELRKNVDAEIRNEVDRISALQQQISDRQHYITELNNKLIEKQNENEALIGKLTALESELDPLRIELANKDARLASMNIVVETTQAQFEEKREVVEEIVRILEKNTSWPLSYEKQDVLSEFQRQLNNVNAKEQEIIRLNQLVESLQNQLHSSQEKDREIFSLNQLVENLQRDLVSFQEKDQEIVRLSKLVDDLQTQLNQTHNKDEEIFNLNTLIESLQKDLGSNQVKDGEICRLNELIEGLQARIDLLQEKEEEILKQNQIIEYYKVQQERSEQELTQLNEEQLNSNLLVADYQQKLEEFKTTHIALQNSLEEKNQLIASLNQQLQLAESLKNDNNRDVQNLQEEMSQLKIDCSNLQESLSECQQQLFKVTEELSDRTSQLDSVNQQLAYSQQNYAIQEAELNNLVDKLQTKEREYASVVEDIRKTQLQDMESHYEEVLGAKDLDIASVKAQLNESISNSQQVNERMNIEVNVRQHLEEKVKQLEERNSEQSALLDEENKQLVEMRSIIEQQVIKIEELKKELFEKSSDYDSLIAEMDIGRKAITQQPTPSANVIDNVATSTSRRPLLEEEDLSEPVSRAELDLALYMLHQRDVRCEELTVELTQLLEERDTLQLRLSNAIREKEEIRRRLPDSEDIATSSSSAPVTPHSKSSAIFLAASGTELASDPLDTSSDLQNLENKLSQLKSVGYRKDKTFVDEQELRRMQQISILQQHINDASRLPPEAAAKLVDATYTLSRDVQSPSKVLLNWLWGRSTPKVNDT